MQLKRYIEAYIPVNICNMKCSYCYLDKNISKVVCGLSHDPEEIGRALSFKRLGGPALINLCAAGETTLLQELPLLMEELLAEGHVLSVVTNGIYTAFFQKIMDMREEYRKRIFFKFSLHYFELLRTGTMETFFENINNMKKAGCSFTIELTPDDKYLEVKEEIKKICMEKAGAICHVTIPRDDTTLEHKLLSRYSLKELVEQWGEFDSSLLAFKSEIWGKRRCEFCYAGDWFFAVDLLTGRMTQCYEGKELCHNIYENINKKLPFRAVGTKCPSTHCFNGHAFLTLGIIPEIPAPAYAELRDRVCADGSSWLTEEMRDTLSSKLKNANKEYGVLKKTFLK